MSAQARAKSLSIAARLVSKDVEDQKLVPIAYQCWRPSGEPGCSMGHIFHRAGFKQVSENACAQLTIILDASAPPGVLHALGGVMATSDQYATDRNNEQARDNLVNAIDKLAHELANPLPRDKEKTGQDISSVAFMQPKAPAKKGRRQ